MSAERCPTCGQELLDIRHFPSVEVHSVELIPIPEKILHWDTKWIRGVGKGEEIDITDEIQEVLGTQPLQQYLDSLRQKNGLVVATHEILPPFEQSEYFSGVFIVPESEYFLNIYSEKDQKGTAVISLLGHGPNFGSGGGPSLHQYVEIAKIKFEGKLLLPQLH